MKRPRLLNSQNSQPVMLEAAVFDGYDMGILMPYIEGANKVMFARSGFFIRRGDHPLCRYWRVPKAKLIDELDLVHHQLIELADGKVTESWQAFRQKIESALSAPHRDAFTWGLLLRIAPLADGGVLLSGDYHPGVVAVARRMSGVFLGRSSSWRINATAEIRLAQQIDSTVRRPNQQFYCVQLRGLRNDPIPPNSPAGRACHWFMQGLESGRISSNQEWPDRTRELKRYAKAQWKSRVTESVQAWIMQHLGEAN